MSGVASDVTGRVRCEVSLHRYEAGLSPMEQEVLPLLAREDLKSYAQLGAQLGIKRATVLSHMQGIACKLRVKAARDVVFAVALERGLL